MKEKKKSNVEAKKCYEKGMVFVCIGAVIISIGIMLKIEAVQWIGCLFMVPMVYFYWRFFELKDDDYEEFWEGQLEMKYKSLEREAEKDD